MGRCTTYPGRSLRVPKKTDREPGDWLTTGVKKSAEGIVKRETSQRRTGGLTNY